MSRDRITARENRHNCLIRQRKECKFNDIPSINLKIETEMNRETGCPGRNPKAAQEPAAICGTKRCSEGKLEEDLRSETVKWQKKAQDLFENISGDASFLDNVSAYIRDCQFFLDKGDLIRAFEAIIWAWAWMEIGLDKGLLRKEAKAETKAASCRGEKNCPLH